MNNNLKKIFAVLGLLSCIFTFAFTESNATAAFVEGCQAYSRGEWENAIFSLKKAIAYNENPDADVYYMLISSELYNTDYTSALNDCDLFLDTFPMSLYSARIQYFKGRILYCLGDYEMSIIVLSDYCHQYQNDEMYPYALFYIGESLFAGYKYEEAAAIYERIIADFPDSDKVSPSQYRLESIAQRNREEKLLYLLKQTGEEYLAAKEEYEKQLRMYNSDTIASARQKLLETQQKNEDLESQINDLEKEITALRNEVAASEKARQAEVEKNKMLIEQSANKVQEPAVEQPKNPVVETEKQPAQNTKKENLDSETKEQLRLLREKAMEAQRRYDEQQNDSSMKNK